MGAPCDGVPGVPGWGPEPQFALGGTAPGPPVGPSDLPEGGLLSMDLCAALLLLVRLQWHNHTCQHMSRVLDSWQLKANQWTVQQSSAAQHMLSVCAESPGLLAETSHLQHFAPVRRV